MNKVLFYVPNLIDYFRLVLIVVSKLNNNFFFITLAFNIILQKKINKGWIYIDNPWIKKNKSIKYQFIFYSV